MSDLHPGGTRRHARTRRLAALTSALAITAGSLLLAPAAVAAPPVATLSIEATPAATEGDAVTVVITADSVTDLYAYDLTVGFDPTLLSFAAGTETGPAGGFTSATSGSGTLTLTHTRLGASPGLATDSAAPAPIELARFSLTALGGGSAQIALVSASLVSSTAETTDLTSVDTATTTLTALPTPPAPAPSTTPGSTPSPTASAAPLAASGNPSGPLATTGADATPWLLGGAVAVALVVAGVLLVLRRRAVTE